MSWANGDLYEGQWKKNKMDGAGQFKQHNGNILKGSFKANYFIHENVLRNPQMPEEEYELFRKQRKEIIKQKEKNEKIKHGFLERITRDSLGRLKEFVEKSNKNNRVPLLVASEHAKFTLADLVDSLGKQVCHVFDLRKAYLLKG